jgi:hypothetical protein
MLQLLTRIKNLEEKISPKNKVMTIVLVQPDTEEDIIREYEQEHGKIDFSQIKNKIILNYNACIAGTNLKSSIYIR